MTTMTSPPADGSRPRLPELTGTGRLLQRIQGEFVEMPGLMLTLPQAARLWCVAAPQAKAALTELVDGGFLMRDPKGVYRRRGACPRCS
jgi:Fic family protein